MILLGPPGVGKTHLAIALGVKAVDAGHRVLFMPLDRLIATLMKAKQENRLERQLGGRLENGKYPTLRLFFVRFDIDTA